jgi:nucleotide-binding universal stress UspA family protein
MERIVVGFDGTEHGERALARAADLAHALTAKLIVVSVGRPSRVPVPEPVLEPVTPTAAAPGAILTTRPPPVPIVEEPTESEETVLLLERARRLLAPRDVDAEFVSELGDPAKRLLQVADDREADLIVVGGREHGLLDRLLGAGVDEKLAHRAHRDVLLVH